RSCASTCARGRAPGSRNGSERSRAGLLFARSRDRAPPMSGGSRTRWTAPGTAALVLSTALGAAHPAAAQSTMGPQAAPNPAPAKPAQPTAAEMAEIQRALDADKKAAPAPPAPPPSVPIPQP